jgi:hypothetical protein
LLAAHDNWSISSFGGTKYGGLASGLSFTVNVSKNFRDLDSAAGPLLVWKYPLGSDVRPEGDFASVLTHTASRSVWDLKGRSTFGARVISVAAGDIKVSLTLVTFTSDVMVALDDTLTKRSRHRDAYVSFLKPAEEALVAEACSRLGLEPDSQSVRLMDIDGDGARDVLALKESVGNEETVNYAFLWLRRNGTNGGKLQKFFGYDYPGLKDGPDTSAWTLNSVYGPPFLFVLEVGPETLNVPDVTVHVFRTIGAQLREVAKFPFRHDCHGCGYSLQSWIRPVSSVDGFEVLTEMRERCAGGWEGGEFGDGDLGFGLCGSYHSVIWKMGSDNKLDPGPAKPMKPSKVLDALEDEPRIDWPDYLFASQWHDGMVQEYRKMFSDSTLRVASRNRLLKLLKAPFRPGQMEDDEGKEFSALHSGLDDLDDDALLSRLNDFIEFKKRLAARRAN